MIFWYTKKQILLNKIRILLQNAYLKCKERKNDTDKIL